ncbi:MAG: tRNA 2-thiouridine(34) synthase MnmA, partial [Candidatus Paceibacteria bacterium]
MKTVFVGLSGGVDSAVSALLLKREGYRVVGAFIKVWEPDFLPCTSLEDRLSAMRVAAHLEIPFVSYDLAEEYKKSVVDYFIGEYKAGRTPNPDVMCNRTIKFGAFWERARADGADFIATGHYAQRIKNSDFVNHYNPHLIENSDLRNHYRLYRGVDETKDQSYFLWTLTQDDLSHALFPIGGVKKSAVRRIASKAGLPNAGRKDSQGLCFLGHVDMREFLKHYLPVKRGSIYGTGGEKLGAHDGVAFYTIGQRVSLSTGEKMYVVGKDVK